MVMTNHARVGTFAYVLASVFLCVTVPVAYGQLFDSDNMVLLANEDLFGGYNDVWGFVGTDGHEYGWSFW